MSKSIRAGFVIGLAALLLVPAGVVLGQSLTESQQHEVERILSSKFPSGAFEQAVMPDQKKTLSGVTVYPVRNLKLDAESLITGQIATIVLYEKHPKRPLPLYLARLPKDAPVTYAAALFLTPTEPTVVKPVQVTTKEEPISGTKIVLEKKGDSESATLLMHVTVNNREFSYPLPSNWPLS